MNSLRSARMRLAAVAALIALAAARQVDAGPPAAASTPTAPPLASGLLPLEGGGDFYEVRGTGPALVLLHDGLLHRETWNAQWESLSKTHRVVRYDRRGYGRSPAPTRSFSEVADLAAVLDHLKVPRATLIGCSAGGELAIDFALAHPARVERLVLVGPVVGGMPFSTDFQTRNAAAFQPLAEKGDVEGAVANWERDPYLIAPAFEKAKREFGRSRRSLPSRASACWRGG